MRVGWSTWLVAMGASAASAARGPLHALVDTRIGTGGGAYGIGSLNPGAQVPFGAMRLGPDTTYIDPVWGQWWLRWNHFGGYYYNDTHIRAFSHTHMVGPGASDWGNHGVMVTRSFGLGTIVDSADAANYSSRFSHDNETAVAGYYAVYLHDASTYAELTVTGTHSGIHQYTCQGSSTSGQPPAPCFLLLDVCHTAIQSPACPFAAVSVGRDPADPHTLLLNGTLLNKGDLSGRGPLGGVYVHVHLRVSAVSANGTSLPPPGVGLWGNNTLLPPSLANASTTSGNMGAFISFGSAGASDMIITVRAGVSYVDVAHAVGNLVTDQYNATTGAWTPFPLAVAAAQAVWDATLSQVSVAPPADVSPAAASSNATAFYSAVYRSLLAPTIYSEYDGSYLGMDQAVHTVWPGGSYRSDMSIWDIHRSQAPLLTLLAPGAALDVTLSLIAMTRQGGRLPRWPLANVYTGCMDGSHAVPIMVDQVVKGLPGVNASDVYAVTTQAIQAQDSQGRYIALGYIPEEDSDTSASSTLEYAYDDSAAALMASFMGDGVNAAVWGNRSTFFRNVFNPQVQQMCPRKANGTWSCPGDFTIPYFISTGYTEGDAVQYQTYAPLQQAQLMALFASPQAWVDALQALQANQVYWPVGNVLPNPWYWAGNEPDILAPWQFATAGNQYANYTQYWTRWLLTEYYTTRADGVPGNDDFGTMSAWAVFAYLGLYPTTGNGEYALGSPFHADVNLTLPNPAGSGTVTVLRILAHNASVNNIYVAGASVNGVPLPTPFVNHSALVPSLYRPDCESIVATGGMQALAASSVSAVCKQRLFGGEAADVGGGPGLLEFFMTDQPVPWSSNAAHLWRRSQRASTRP